MKILIAEDDLATRKYIKDSLSDYGECDAVVNGKEAIQAFRLALDDNSPYDLVCMDIMMPEVNGQQALFQIRELEKMKNILGDQEVKVLMISALDDPKNVMQAFYEGGASSYVTKPVDKNRLIEEIRNLGLV